MESDSRTAADGPARAGCLLIVEDHGLVREGLRMLSQASGCFTAVLEAGSLSAAMAELRAAQAPPDLVLLDLGLPDADGFTALQRLVEECPEAPVLVVSGSDDPAAIDEAFARGARGYVPKNSSPRTLRAAIETALQGELYVPPHVLPSRSQANRPLKASRTPSAEVRLTRRQNDVLFQLACGLSNKEIAAELNMSLSTVRVHVSTILKLLGAENRTQAAMSSNALKLLGAEECRGPAA